MLSKEIKKDIVGKYGKSDEDTGAVEVQVALLTQRIRYLTEHLKNHKKDYSSRRGLLMLVGQRRKLLSYIKKASLAKYKQLLESLGIRK